jgi:HK97 family phage major capsid protein
MGYSDLSVTELKQKRGDVHKHLVELDALPDKDEAARIARQGVNVELRELNAEIGRREGRMEEEKEAAHRQLNRKSGEYENGMMIKPSESVRSYLQDNGLIKQPEFEGLGLGALMRSMVNGARNDLERRALAEGSDSTGGVSVPDITLVRFIDRLRAAQVCIKAGAVTVPLTSDRTTIARTASDPVAAWRLENAPVEEDEPTFEGVVLVPRSLAVLVKASRELIDDSVNIEQALEAALRGALATELDRVALLGAGIAPEPRGIFNTVGVNSFTSGTLDSYDDFIDAMKLNWEDDSPITSAIIMSPRSLATVAKLKEATTNAPLRKPDVLQDIPMMMTSSMDNYKAILGDFSRLIIGIRTSLRIEVLRELYAENLQYGFIAHLRADIAVEHPEAFCRMIIST